MSSLLAGSTDQMVNLKVQKRFAEMIMKDFMTLYE